MPDCCATGADLWALAGDRDTFAPPEKFVITEQIEEVIALLNEALAFLNEAITASPERQLEIRMEFDRIMDEIDKIRLSYQN